MAKKTYEVSGSASVLGHEPGEQFAAELVTEREQFYLRGGHLKIVTPSKGEKPASSKGGDTKEKQ
jgi:hypothetical protein